MVYKVSKDLFNVRSNLFIWSPLVEVLGVITAIASDVRLGVGMMIFGIMLSILSIAHGVLN